MKTLEQVRQEKVRIHKLINELDVERQELVVQAIELQGQEKLLAENGRENNALDTRQSD